MAPSGHLAGGIGGPPERRVPRFAYSRKRLVEYLKRIAFRHTKLGAPQYPFKIEPIQLAALVFEIERLSATRGSILEVGVARGMTTRFLAEHIVTRGLEGERIFAIDTFESFLRADLEYEIAERGKNLGDLRGFEYNDYEVWKRNFRRFPFVVPVRADCSTFDYAGISPIKLAFLDVDLYLPTRRALEQIHARLCEGGVIFVDDVRADQPYDGAYHAYMEFCGERGIRPELIGSKCGVIRR